MKWKHIWAAALALFFLFILTACGNERIFSASPAETGESYSSNDFSSGNPATSEKALKLQADFDSFCSDLFHTEMESSSTLDLHYTLLHSENYGIDAGMPPLALTACPSSSQITMTSMISEKNSTTLILAPYQQTSRSFTIPFPR